MPHVYVRIYIDVYRYIYHTNLSCLHCKHHSCTSYTVSPTCDICICVVLYIHICQCIPSPSPVLMHGPVTIGARVPRTQRPRPGPPRTTSTAGVIWNKKDCESLSMANACAHTRTYRATSVFLVVGIVWCCLGALF
jgi:hypothetical protein